MILGQDLAFLQSQHGNTVIYMVDLFGSPNFVPYLCAAYLKLFRSYAALVEMSKLDHPNDIVLQIIPGDLVASPDAITLPSPEAYRRIALEVYNRCGPDLDSDPRGRVQFSSAPSIQLARPIPKSISLKLSPEPSVDFLQADMFFHVAYSWWPGQQWLTASWTDNQGELQWTAPYCVGPLRAADPWPVLSAIFTEIWETTLELFRHPDSPWRLFIVKDSPLHQKELEGERFALAFLEDLGLTAGITASSLALALRSGQPPIHCHHHSHRRRSSVALFSQSGCSRRVFAFISESIQIDGHHTDGAEYLPGSIRPRLHSWWHAESADASQRGGGIGS